MSMVKIRAALETALLTLGELVPSIGIVSIASGSSAVVTTVAPHKLLTGTSVTISGNSNVNGVYLINVLSATTFSLLHKVTEAPFASAAKGTGGVCTPNLTAWDNVAFKPVPGVPYQKVNVLFAQPDDITMGAGYYREHGFMQVSLHYPILLGTYEITNRVEQIRTLFSRGASFEKDGVTVKVPRTPMVMTGMPIDESYVLPVRVFFQADIFR